VNGEKNIVGGQINSSRYKFPGLLDPETNYAEPYLQVVQNNATAEEVEKRNKGPKLEPIIAWEL